MLQLTPRENKGEFGIPGKKRQVSNSSCRAVPAPCRAEQSCCFYQGQDFAGFYLAYTGPQESAVLWHYWDRNPPHAAKFLCSYLIYFSKLLKQLNCSFARNWHKMRKFGLGFNNHRSEALHCLFGYVAVLEAGMDGGAWEMAGVGDLGRGWGVFGCWRWERRSVSWWGNWQFQLSCGPEARWESQTVTVVQGTWCPQALSAHRPKFGYWLDEGCLHLFICWGPSFFSFCVTVNSRSRSGPEH